MDIVTIHSAGCRETGMQVIRHAANTTDGNIVRQKLIEFVSQLPTVNLSVDIEMGHHHTGVNTCIGTPCPCHRNITTEQQRQRSLQLMLHRVAVGLYLPAMITGTIVAESDKISHRLRTTASKLEGQVVGTATVSCRLLCRGERSGCLRNCGLGRERSSIDWCSSHRRNLTSNNIVRTNIVVPTAVELAGIDVKLYGDVLIQLDIELLDAVLTEDVKHHLTRELSRYLNNIFLCHPGIARTI